MMTTLAQRLAALIDDHAPASEASTSDQRTSLAGDVATSASELWTPQERAAFSAQVLSDPAILNAQHPGITRSRVRVLLPDHRKAQVDAVLDWLDRAQVLQPPITPTLPFRHPRRLACTTTEELCNRLNATPHPMFNPHSPAQPVIPLVQEAPCVP